MFCQKCGTQSVAGDRFCKKCGCLLDATNNKENSSQNMNGNLDSKYVQNAVNPNTKLWAILSIIIPVAGMLWYWFIGLSVYLAILIALAGFACAEKSQMNYRKAATTGKVLNGMLLGMAIVITILEIIALIV